MKTHTRAVVIGGGILGCSMLYFLTRRGWRDVVLVEKRELTSGATWHAAGQVPALVRSGAGRFQLTSPAADEQRFEDWLRGHLPADGVALTNVTAERGVLALAGPKARGLLAALTTAPLANGDFPWFAAREIEVAGVPVLALRMSLTGELGWELHHAAGDQGRLYDALFDAGAAHGLVDFGLRALESMRLEKGWRRAGLDYGLAATPEEAGLDRLVRPEKGDFLGREAFLAARERTDGERLVSLRIDVGDDAADPWAEEAVLRDAVEIARHQRRAWSPGRPRNRPGAPASTPRGPGDRARGRDPRQALSGGSHRRRRLRPGG